jgi:nitroreductase
MQGPREIPGLLEAIATARSIHRYRRDPISETDLAAILWAGTRGPSGSNSQPFRFLVLRDGPRAVQARALLGGAFRAEWARKSADEGWERGDASPRRLRSARAMQRFVDRFEEIPAIVLACFVRRHAPNPYDGLSVYPACQNILLAARGLGYGACFSLWHIGVEDGLRGLLEIPDDAAIAATITLGRPEGRHGPLRRRPARELVFDDAWGRPAAWVADPEGSRFSRGPRERAL